MSGHQIPGTLLLDTEVLEDPYPFFARLRTEAPVWHVPGTDLFTVTSYELVTQAALRVEDFSNNINCLLYRDDAGLPQRLTYAETGLPARATADPPAHAAHRKAGFPQLVTKRMAALEPEITAIADDRLTRALAAPSVDFMAEVANIVPITLVSRLVGFRDSDLDQLLEAAFDSTAKLGAALSRVQLVAAIGRTRAVHDWIDDQLATAGHEAPGDDLLGAVTAALRDGVFGAFEANVILHTLLSAGGESTTSLLGNAVQLLAQTPDLQTRLREHPDQIPAFVEEVLRLESPFRYLMRSVPYDTELGGVAVPAGSTVLLMWAAANRDDAEFARPDDVDLERRVRRRHVTFGHGMHLCVGAPLARLETCVALTRLLERTSSITPDPARPPRRVQSLLIRRHEQLPVRLDAR